jgi:hypothetical protein
LLTLLTFGGGAAAAAGIRRVMLRPRGFEHHGDHVM